MDTRSSVGYPVEPWELRAYVEEAPERGYRVRAPSACLVARYLQERLGTAAEVGQEVTTLDGETYWNPPWVRDLVMAFDRMAPAAKRRLGSIVLPLPLTGKQILEADILPGDDG